MPELPEVETVRLGLEPVLRGQRFTHVEQRRRDLRFPLPARFVERLTGRKVINVGRRAKYLLVHLDDGCVLAMHLGMTGRFSVRLPGRERHASPPPPRGEGLGAGGATTAGDGVSPPPCPSPTRGEGAHAKRSRTERPHTARAAQAHAPHPNPLPTERGEGTQLGEFTHAAGGDAAHDHVVFEMSSGVVVTYNDARRFGYMTLVPEAELSASKFFRGLGVEPLGNELNAAYLAERARGRKADLKAFLMDQRIVAGLGNIYVCEALYRAGLSPFRPAGRLATSTGRPQPAAERLVGAIKAVLGDAIRAGGSTLRDYRRADGALGEFQHAFDVYGREGEACRRKGCRGRVRRKTQGGRSTFYCPACQR
jgi:formamidopyrimidine-DNA glycosylase